MNAADTGELSESAYAIFEFFFRSQLHMRKKSLSHIVESGEPFEDLFHEIFTEFSNVYPIVFEYLISQFQTPEEIYRMIREGEGVIPSKTFQARWIEQDSPHVDGRAADIEKAGKWLVFLPPDQVDDIWRQIRDLTWEGKLGISAKVSTAKPDPDARDERKVIYVYTADWEDEADVMRVREELRRIGITDRIGYKRNIETFKGEYSAKGKKVTFYSA
ncbi:MAG TPA: DUF1917 domain-containing protein [Methanospirillum sp.]|uniref:putative phosphothreonine lyase domain-containing protein n=1 Tax=Methanospirillum sp. TaxID=45200 RepID=UPI002C26BB48|nr:putative phosphothreonine lyase domain-containg protein [Methanospirillum sp.]HOJ96988.1 DUF1917 domain-containing protein [Methanospirillum sp.]HOL40892.1 DUF1917 domain-containing protein [Methanospirillum sp.]HPP77365.1 DUF1917 domain-containing protein [Methanospirillum sp.]